MCALMATLARSVRRLLRVPDLKLSAPHRPQFKRALVSSGVRLPYALSWLIRMVSVSTALVSARMDTVDPPVRFLAQVTSGLALIPTTFINALRISGSLLVDVEDTLLAALIMLVSALMDTVAHSARHLAQVTNGLV